MSDTQHEKKQMELLDVFYLVKEMPQDLKTHLESCGQCQKYWEDLNKIKTLDPLDDSSIEVDERLIRNAFNLAEEKQSQRQRIKDTVLFVVVASVLMSSVVSLALRGYSLQLLQIQIALAVIAPLSVPFFIRQRLVKEEK